MTRTAIEVRFLAPTNTRPARLKALTMSSHPVAVSQSLHSIPGDTDLLRNEYIVAKLLNILGDGWGDIAEWRAGGTADGYVFVRISPLT